MFLPLVVDEFSVANTYNSTLEVMEFSKLVGSFGPGNFPSPKSEDFTPIAEHHKSLVGASSITASWSFPPEFFPRPFQSSL